MKPAPEHRIWLHRGHLDLARHPGGLSHPRSEPQSGESPAVSCAPRHRARPGAGRTNWPPSDPRTQIVPHGPGPGEWVVDGEQGLEVTGREDGELTGLPGHHVIGIGQGRDGCSEAPTVGGGLTRNAVASCASTPRSTGVSSSQSTSATAYRCAAASSRRIRKRRVPTARTANIDPPWSVNDVVSSRKAAHPTSCSPDCRPSHRPGRPPSGSTSAPARRTELGRVPDLAPERSARPRRAAAPAGLAGGHQATPGSAARTAVIARPRPAPTRCSRGRAGARAWHPR